MLCAVQTVPLQRAPAVSSALTLPVSYTNGPYHSLERRPWLTEFHNQGHLQNVSPYDRTGVLLLQTFRQRSVAQPSLEGDTFPGNSFPGSCTIARVPDLFVDGVQLLLEHHGQRLGIGLPTGRQQSRRAEQSVPVVLAVRQVDVALECLRYVRQDTGLLGTLPVLLVESLYLWTRNHTSAHTPEPW